MTLREAILQQAKECLAGPPVMTHDCLAWWRSDSGKHFHYLLPGARSLLHFNMGNAWGERRFSKCARLFGTKLSNRRAIDQRLSLHCNAVALGLRGYSNPQECEDDTGGDGEDDPGGEMLFTRVLQ